MAGQAGRDVLIRIQETDGSFDTLAGIRTSRLEVAAAKVDATSADSPQAWRELIAGAAPRTARISGAGVFKDAPSDALMRAAFFGAETPRWQFVIPGFGVMEGAFLISSLNWSGRHDGEAEFAVTLESAGPITFEAA